MGYFLVEKNKNGVKNVIGWKEKVKNIRTNPYPTQTPFLARVLGKLRRSYKKLSVPIELLYKIECIGSTIAFFFTIIGLLEILNS